MAIEVGTPVARRPPRGSRRAELPHRAPRWTRSQCDAGPRFVVVGLDHAVPGFWRNKGVNGNSTTRGGGRSRPGRRERLRGEVEEEGSSKANEHRSHAFNQKSAIVTPQSSMSPKPPRTTASLPPPSRAPRRFASWQLCKVRSRSGHGIPRTGLPSPPQAHA